jgi:hypothetical protein
MMSLVFFRLVMRRCVHHHIIVADGSSIEAPSTRHTFGTRAAAALHQSAPFADDACLWRTAVQLKSTQRSVYFIDAQTDASIIKAANMVIQRVTPCFSAVFS